jgi:hypothetical protein
MLWAYRCMTLDVISYIALGKSVRALETPGFKAPLLESMDAGATIFNWFKHSDLFRRIVFAIPPDIAMKLSPDGAGMIKFEALLLEQIQGLLEDPERTLAELPHQMSIYHRLMDPSTYVHGKAPEGESLREEAEILLFAGSDTVGNALMVGTHYLLHNSVALTALKSELHEAWPVLDQAPKLAQLEKLPYLTAVIKESLRRSHGAVSGLPRVVPAEGARISGVHVPAGVRSKPSFLITFTNILPRPSCRLEVRSCTMTPASFPSRIASARSAGSRTPTSISGSSRSLAVRGHVWASSMSSTPSRHSISLTAWAQSRVGRAALDLLAHFPPVQYGSIRSQACTLSAFHRHGAHIYTVLLI